MTAENKILYQTLEDRDNPDEIERHVGQNWLQGKLCHRKNVLSI